VKGTAAENVHTRRDASDSAISVCKVIQLSAAVWVPLSDTIVIRSSAF